MTPIDEHGVAYLEKYPWIDPTKGYPDDTLIEGVVEAPQRMYVLVSQGWTHKTIIFGKPITNRDIVKVNDLDWEIFHVYLIGHVKGRTYYWGMPLEGLGLMHCQFLADHCRDFLPAERELWANRRMGMYGSHTGNLSYTMPSGIAPNDG